MLTRTESASVANLNVPSSTTLVIRSSIMSLGLSIPPGRHEKRWAILDGLTLRVHDPNSNPYATHLQVHVDKIIHRCKRRVVFGGQVSGSSGSAPQQVVCKVSYDRVALKAAEQEARAYHRLRSLQGTTIPKFYGLFIGESSDGLAACMVLEYCGERVLRFRTLSPKVKCVSIFIY